MEKLTFLQLAQKVLAEHVEPLSAQEIWEIAVAKNYDKELPSIGQTPNRTLSAKLYTSVKEEQSIFTATNDKLKRFYLREMKDKIDFKNVSEKKIIYQKVTKTYLEKDLHPLLAYYAQSSLNVYCKTINHSKSGKKEFGEWLHPDVVGCWFPIGNWSSSTIDLSQALGVMNVRLYSFELKRELNFSNLREAFFQAVSNSSWAHEGYLCTADISKEDDFLSENLSSN